MDEIHKADPHKKIIMLELRGKLEHQSVPWSPWGCYIYRGVVGLGGVICYV